MPDKKCNWMEGICAKMFKKEAKEHPTMTKPMVRQIVTDHLKLRKKS